MDPSSVEEKAAIHGDEELNDEIFDILFPSSPGEGTEEKDDSHVEFQEYEFLPEAKKESEQNTIKHSINEVTKITDMKTVTYNCSSSENESDLLQYNNNLKAIENNKNDKNKSISKDNLPNANSDHSINKQYLGITMNEDKSVNTKIKSNNYLEEAPASTTLEPILPTNEDLVFEFSDVSLSDEEHENPFKKLKVNLADFLVSDDISDRKPSPRDKKKRIVKSETKRKIETKNNKDYLNLGSNKIKTISKDKFLQNEDVIINKNDSSKTKKTLDNKIDISKNNGKDSKCKYENLKNEVTDKNSNKENKKKNSNNVCEKNVSKSEYLKNTSDLCNHGNENIDSFNNEMGGEVTSITNNVTNRKISEKTNESLKIEKQTSKKGNVLEEDTQKKELDPQNEDNLEDISDDDMEDSCGDGKKKKKEEFHKENILEDISDEEDAHKRDWATEEKRNKREEQYKRRIKDCNINLDSSSSDQKRVEPIPKYSESSKRKYDEIIIIGDERLPSLKSYKNVKIFREEGLELRNTLSFITKLSRSGLLKGSQHSRLIILCVGLNDIIMKTTSRDCYNINKKKSHSPCYLFRYATITCILFNEIMKGVEKISEYLGDSCHVKMSSLYMFDIKSINKNLSLEHYHKFGHHANLVGGDIHNNKKIHTLIKNVNTSLCTAMCGTIDLFSWDEYTMIDYQEETDINFTADTRKLIVNNIKTIQRNYSYTHADAKETEISKDDLRWALNRSKERDVYSLKEVLQPSLSRKGWHSPDRCISPTGWHPEETCRKKEQQRTKRKLLSLYKSRSPRKDSFLLEISREEKSRNSNRIEIIGNYRSLRGKGTEEEIERQDRDSRKLSPQFKDSASKKRSRNLKSTSSRGNDGGVKRQNSEIYERVKKQSPTFFDRSSQKSRSSSRPIEKELDNGTCEALRNLREVHDRSCQMYIENPAAHPDYNKEYYSFYEAKSQKIREIGGDPFQYDFLPDWQKFWHTRSKELFREAWLSMKNQCIQMMEEKKLSQEKKIHEERRIQEDKSNYSKSVSSSSSPRSSRSRNTNRDQRGRSSDRREQNYKKGKKSEKCNSSPTMINTQKYDEKEDLISNERDLNTIKNKSQLEILIEKELEKGLEKISSVNESIEIPSISKEMLRQVLESNQKTNIDFGKTVNFPLPSVYEESYTEDLGLEEVGESVIPFNLGKYVPESEEYKEKRTEKSNSDDILEVLIMLNQLGDKMGSLVGPIKTLLDKANQENMKNSSTMNIFKDTDASIAMQLVSSKLVINIQNENINAIEKAIFQEVKNKVDKLLKSVEETFVEGVNIEHIAEKSLGMESAEVINCIKSVLHISASSSFSVEKLMKIYKAVKDRQFRYIENPSDINTHSDSLEMAYPIQSAETHNDSDVNLSPTEIPFNLPTRKTSNPSEKYDPFKEEYF